MLVILFVSANSPAGGAGGGGGGGTTASPSAPPSPVGSESTPAATLGGGVGIVDAESVEAVDIVGADDALVGGLLLLPSSEKLVFVALCKVW